MARPKMLGGTRSAAVAPVRRRQRPFVASGRQIDVSDARQIESYRRRMMSAQWQEPAWVFNATVPELGFGHDYVRDSLARVRPFPAIMSDDPEEGPIPLTDDAAPSGLDPDLADEIVQRLAPHPNFMGMSAQKMDIVGECYIALLADDDSITGETCRVFSSRELITQDNKTWRYREAPDDYIGTPIPDGTPFWRIWTPDPEYGILPFSHMVRLNATCERLLILNRLIKSFALSRLATTGKILAIADEFSLESAAMPNEVATEDAGDGEALGDTFFDDFMAAGAEAILDSESASAVMNLVIRGPMALIKEGIQVIDISRTMEDTMQILRDKAKEEIANGINLPREIILGVGDTNHWNAEQIKEQAWLNHLEPRAYAILAATTTAFYRPALLANDVDPDIVRRCVLWYDPTWFLGEPDRAESADFGYENMILSAEAWRAAKNFTADDAPEEDEIEYRILVQQRLHVRTTITDAGTTDASTIEPANTPDPKELQPPDEPVEVPEKVDTQTPPAPAPSTAPAVKAPPAKRAARAESAQRALAAAPADTADDDDEPTGVMVALMLPPAQAQTLAGLLGSDPTEMHVTIAYLGDAADLTLDQQMTLGQIVRSAAAASPQIDGMTLPAVYEFGQANDERAVVIKPYLPGIHALHDTIVQACEDAGLPVRTNFAYDQYEPHITLGYIGPDDDFPDDLAVPSLPLHVGAVTVCIAAQQVQYPLDATPAEAAATLLTAASRPTSSPKLATLGSRHVSIERDTRARLMEACDSTVGRALEVAGLKVRMKLKGKGERGKALAMSVQDVTPALVPSRLGKATVTAFGLDDHQLLAGATATLEPKFRQLVMRGQHAALAAACVATGHDPDYDTLDQHAKPGIDLGWTALAAGLAGLAAAALYNPQPDKPSIGEYDGSSLIPPGLVRAALDLAGGAPQGNPQTVVRGAEIPETTSPIAGTPDTAAGATGGPTMMQAYYDQAGIAANGYTWVYGDAPRTAFPPHEDLDGQDFSSPDDDTLSGDGDWPYVDYYSPGDHDGCQCDWSLSFIESGPDVEAQDAGAVDPTEGTE